MRLSPTRAYFRRSLLPRFGSAFAGLAGLAPFTDMMEATTMLFSIPRSPIPRWWRGCRSWPTPHANASTIL